MKPIASSAPFAKETMKLVTNLEDVLKAEYDAKLACFCVEEGELSIRQYQKLRLAFCRNHSPKGWVKKLWYQCPVTGKKIYMPEPLVPIHVWKAAQRAKVQQHGLLLSQDGKVSQRGFTESLQRVMKRDAHHLKEFSPDRPAQPVWGIDHAAISNCRDFTHGGISLGALYKQGSSCLSELKMTTCVIGQMNDDASGLRTMLGPQPAFESEGGLKMPATAGIGAEIATLLREGELDGVPMRPAVCLDFAAVRGMRCGRGKCAALCACKGQDSLQSYPGGGEVPDLPAGDTIEDYQCAVVIAEAQCSWGSELIAYPRLRSAAHTPPSAWDFAVQGPWKCCWAGCDYSIDSWETHKAEVAALADLKFRSADDSAVKKVYDAKMAAHSNGHADQMLFQPPILEGVDMNIFIIDLLHCLNLNLAKTAWKYSFGDRMTPDQRERVAAYLTSIGCHLDLREKGKRDPQQKWFSGSQFDEFVLGELMCAKSKSQGLVKNILALIELVFDIPTVEEAEAGELEEPPAKKQRLRHVNNGRLQLNQADLGQGKQRLSTPRAMP